jgi:protein-S-isoprenylcysteine O-methyltransferase Ste14
VGNLLVPKSIDSGPETSLSVAVLADTLLLFLFAVPHSVMARPGFKKWWTQFIPAPLERSTYVLVASLTFALLFWQWRPIPAVFWHVANPVARLLVESAFWAGWVIALVSTFLIDHFDLFGLSQVYLYATGRPYTPADFKVVGLYRWMRHPLMTGFLLAFWASSIMTLGHLLFAVAMTVYIIVALQFEERDLVSVYGERYKAYRSEAGMLLPLPKGGRQ